MFSHWYTEAEAAEPHFGPRSVVRMGVDTGVEVRGVASWASPCPHWGWGSRYNSPPPVSGGDRGQVSLEQSAALNELRHLEDPSGTGEAGLARVGSLWG